VAVPQMPPAMASAAREAPALGTPLASRGRGPTVAVVPSNGSGQHRTEHSAPASKPSSGQQLPPPGPLQPMTLEDLEPLDGEGGRSLGKGSFGVVRRVRLRRGNTNELFALKSMQKREVIDSDLVDQVEREIAFQSCMQHENVLRLYKHFQDDEAVYLLLEFCAKGELYQLLRTRRGRRFTETVAQHYFVQVTRGLRYLHSQQIVHRDLKPENLLVNQDDVLKIADFGWCAKTTEPRFTFCGTLDYLAPEMIMQRGHNHTLDVWSVGVLLYEMVVGRPPFQSTNHQLLINKIMSIELRYPPFVPPGVADLVGRLLQMDPVERLPLDEVLRHPWVTTSHSAATSPGPQREASCSPTPTDNIQRRLHPQQLHLIAAGTAAAAAAAAAAVPLQSRDGTPVASRVSQVQATPRDASRGCATEPTATPHAQQQQQQLASPSSGSCCSAACGRSHSGASVVAAPAAPGVGRGQYSFTPSALGSRSATAASSAALHGSRGAAHQLHHTHAHSSQQQQQQQQQQSGACCYSASAPQTPVQQVPFRGIQGTGSAAAASTNSNSGMPTPLLERRRASRCESQGPGAGQASSPMHSPTRRPRSSGLPQTHLPTRGARQVDLVNTSMSSTHIGGGPTAPPTPAQQHRKPAVPRVGGGLAAGQAAPGSPKPCGAGRSLSPSAPPSGSYSAAAAAGAVAAALASAPVPTAYGGHRSGNLVRQQQRYAQRTRSPSCG